MQVRIRHIVSIVLLFFALLAAIAGFFYQHWFLQPYVGKKTVVVRLYPGQSLPTLIAKLEQKKLLVPESAWYLRLLMAGKSLKIGEYELKPGMTLLEFFSHVGRARVKIHRFAIIPGWTVNQMLKNLASKVALKPEALTDKVVVEALGIHHKNPEGLFYPATYRYYWGSSAMDILRKSHRKMQVVLAKEWENRAPGLPYKNSYRALIAASLIEKETHAKDERPVIARVILNRLKKHMRLQIDPTVIYAAKDPGIRFVTLKMLKTDSLYNTYRHKGLPPTPICLPSKGSIHAALHPAKSDALFYVALGDGIHHRFSKTFGQHKAYVSDYRQRRAEQKKRQPCFCSNYPAPV